MGTERKESSVPPAFRSADVARREAMIARPSRNTIDVIASGSWALIGEILPSSPTSATRCSASSSPRYTQSEPRFAPRTSRTSARILRAPFVKSSVEPSVSLIE